MRLLTSTHYSVDGDQITTVFLRGLCNLCACLDYGRTDRLGQNSSVFAISMDRI